MNKFGLGAHLTEDIDQLAKYAPQLGSGELLVSGTRVQEVCQSHKLARIVVLEEPVAGVSFDYLARCQDIFRVE